MPSIQYSLIDENTDLAIPAGYDPLLKNTFDEYIHITEKENPGRRRSFNNVPNQATRDVHVSGLVLHWSKDLSRSKLRAVAERESVERLYMYADTVIIDAHLRLPQTHVTIYARRLIVGQDGAIDTTPNPFANPYADDSRPKERTPKYTTNHGAGGNSAGDITLLVQTLQCPEGKTCFVMNGSDGQHGEKGGLKERVTSNDVPVSWEKVFSNVISGIAQEHWFTWPDNVKHELQTGLIYYAYVHINEYKLVKYVDRFVSFGDRDAVNADNGLDAYASGDGGNGGNGGTLRLIDPSVPAACVSQRGGQPGRSDRIEGTKKASNATDKKHVSFAVVGTHPATTGLPGDRRKEYPNKDRGFKEYTKILPAKDGDTAKGSDGLPGKDGGIEWLAGQGGAWLHPYVLETVVQYAKDMWLKGDRRPGRWLLQWYQTAFQAHGRK